MVAIRLLLLHTSTIHTYCYGRTVYVMNECVCIIIAHVSVAYNNIMGLVVHAINSSQLRYFGVSIL